MKDGNIFKFEDNVCSVGTYTGAPEQYDDDQVRVSKVCASNISLTISIFQEPLTSIFMKPSAATPSTPPYSTTTTTPKTTSQTTATTTTNSGRS